MALAALRLKRLALVETRMVSAHHNAAIRNTELVQSIAALRGLLPGRTESEPSAAPLEDDPIARAFIRDSERGNTIINLARYQNSRERSYYLALHELEYRIPKLDRRLPETCILDLALFIQKALAFHANRTQTRP